MKQITKKKLAELNGYAQANVFHQWIKGTKHKAPTKEMKHRYDALMIGSTFLENGFMIHEAIGLIERNEALKERVAQLEREKAELEYILDKKELV